jgi:hypothetical protein
LVTSTATNKLAAILLETIMPDSPIDRPIVHLFVGLHKTGTTAIRVMLEIHRETFGRYAFHIPRATWTTYNNHLFNGGHNNIPWEIVGNRPPLSGYGTVADLVREIASLPSHQHILITEDLDLAQSEHVAQLKQAFADFDVRVVLFIRNQVDWLQANYAEDQKWFGTPSFERYYRRLLAADARLDLNGLCARWADAFGTLTIRCYEDIRSRVFDAFLECCGAPSELRSTLGARGLPLINRSPGDLPLALIRDAQVRAVSHGIAPEFFNAIVSPAAREAAAQLGRFSERQSRITPDIARGLFPLMRASNRALVARFGVALGPAYLDPSLPAEPSITIPPEFDLETVAGVILSTATDVTRRFGALMRLAASNADSADHVGEQIAQLVQRTYPWRPFKRGSDSLLDTLIAEADSQVGVRLYLERVGERSTAYRQVAGTLLPLREIPAPEWQRLIDDTLFRAGLGVAGGYDLKQGLLRVERDGGSRSLRAWHTITDTGEVAIVRDADERWETSRAKLPVAA